MKKKERLMGLIMAIIISAAMGVAATFLVRLFNPQVKSPLIGMLLMNIGLSVVLGIIISLVLPLGKLGRKLAAAAHANPPSFKFTLLNSLPISVINSVIIGFLLSGFGIFLSRRNIPPQALANMPPFPVMWIISFLKILVPTTLISYLLAVILSPIVSQMVGIADAGAEIGQASNEDK